MNDAVELQTITLKIAPQTHEQIAFVANAEGKTIEEIAARFLNDEAEAQASLMRGPVLRKHMYR
jgi:predicted HicB family RNase H-like nuclease